MLAHLLVKPTSAAEWALFSWAHRDQHDQIRQVIQELGGPNLTEYQLDPIVLDRFQDFLAANQQTHNDMNGVLQLQGNDLSQLDPANQNETDAWIWLHFKEHQDAAIRLHIG